MIRRCNTIPELSVQSNRLGLTNAEFEAVRVRIANDFDGKGVVISDDERVRCLLFSPPLQPSIQLMGAYFVHFDDLWNDRQHQPTLLCFRNLNEQPGNLFEGEYRFNRSFIDELQSVTQLQPEK